MVVDIFIVSDMTATDIPRRINPELSPLGRSFRPSATIPGGGGGGGISLDRCLRRRKYQGEGIYYDTGEAKFPMTPAEYTLPRLPEVYQIPITDTSVSGPAAPLLATVLANVTNNIRVFTIIYLGRA